MSNTQVVDYIASAPYEAPKNRITLVSHLPSSALFAPDHFTQIQWSAQRNRRCRFYDREDGGAEVYVGNVDKDAAWMNNRNQEHPSSCTVGDTSGECRFVTYRYACLCIAHLSTSFHTGKGPIDERPPETNHNSISSPNTNTS